MDKLTETISRLSEVEGQLRHIALSRSMDPDWPEEQLSLIADDIHKARKDVEDLRG